ncbi:MAG: SpoIIE family protein phosphatase [bacterium]|jgi:PAS domain S-box-containing protein
MEFESLNLVGLLHQLGIGLYITDTDRRIIFWNKRAEHILGWTADEVVGKHCRDNLLDHIDKEGRPLCDSQYCPLFKAITTARASDEPVIAYARKSDGARLCVSLNVAPVYDRNGIVIGGVETFRDESERERQLGIAKRVQEHVIKFTEFDDPRISFGQLTEARDEVTGDFSHVYQPQADSYGLVVADVIGHGFSAALITTMIHSFFHENVELWIEPSSMLANLNERICALGMDYICASVALARIDLNPLSCTVTHAGAPGIVCLRDGKPVWVGEAGGVPCGMFDREIYAEETFDIQPGDRILAHSDGATDIVLEDGTLLGAEKLYEIIGGIKPGNEQAGLAEKFGELYRLSSEVTLRDDLTLLTAYIDPQ